MEESLAVVQDTVATEQGGREAHIALPLGIIRGLSNDAYHADRSALSSTRLKPALVSGEHFLAALSDTDESSEALLYGSALHTYMLEPEKFDQEYFCVQRVDARTKAGKAEKEAQLVVCGARTPIPQEWRAELEAIRWSAGRHKTAARLMGGAEREVAFVWVDPETGLRLKVKADVWNEDLNIVSDLKSCTDASEDAFAKQCVRFGYPLSAAMYCEGVYRVTGRRPEWRFIAAEKSPPFSVAVYRPTETFMRRGERLFRQALRRVATWKADGVYPPLQPDGEAQWIDLPSWA